MELFFVEKFYVRREVVSKFFVDMHGGDPDLYLQTRVRITSILISRGILVVHMKCRKWRGQPLRDATTLATPLKQKKLCLFILGRRFSHTVLLQYPQKPLEPLMRPNHGTTWVLNHRGSSHTDANQDQKHQPEGSKAGWRRN